MTKMLDLLPVVGLIIVTDESHYCGVIRKLYGVRGVDGNAVMGEEGEKGLALGPVVHLCSGLWRTMSGSPS